MSRLPLILSLLLYLSACVDEATLRGQRPIEGPQHGMMGESPWLGKPLRQLVAERGQPSFKVSAPRGVANIYPADSNSGGCRDTYVTNEQDIIIGYHCR